MILIDNHCDYSHTALSGPASQDLSQELCQVEEQLFRCHTDAFHPGAADARWHERDNPTAWLQDVIEDRRRGIDLLLFAGLLSPLYYWKYQLLYNCVTSIEGTGAHHFMNLLKGTS